ncbi:MAG TPA: patatin-like phospholipase family protein [Burkholderiaceae bacterium]|nr:patatin-like phospholipase family protein [Burkholderiaceae bacterium]
MARAAAKAPKPVSGGGEELIFVLQGGGALGAYQAGVYEALSARGLFPQWVGGISIGAINAALIAGNEPKQRVARLREFWQTVTAQYSSLFPVVPGVEARTAFNGTIAAMSSIFGLPGFFTPRVPGFRTISFYDTAPLKTTLENLVDFDLLNSDSVRLSVGAVNVRSGNFIYFDTSRQRLDARHIMASAALPPGFPPIEIDGEWYWDGGLVSNTPLQYVLDQPGRRPRLVFQVDLFPAEGQLPTNLAEVADREKDIEFSSRTRLNTTNALARESLAQAVARLAARLPRKFANDPDLRTIQAASRQPAVTVVHLIYRRRRYEAQSRDFEFSRVSMREHWHAGHEDMVRTLDHPVWVGRKRRRAGVQVFDLTRDAVHAGARRATR